LRGDFEWGHLKMHVCFPTVDLPGEFDSLLEDVTLEPGSKLREIESQWFSRDHQLNSTYPAASIEISRGGRLSGLWATRYVD
jgi:hypothetical protein